MRKPPTVADDAARGRRPFRGNRAAQLVPQPRLAGPMPWLIAIMVALTVIAAAGGLALANMASGARAELAGGATVQILEAFPGERDRQARAAQMALRDSPLVAEIRRVPDAEIDALLEPWLGVGVEEDAVPIPALIDVRLTREVDEEMLTQLRRLLIETAPAARIDAQSSWLAPIFSAIGSLQWLSAALVALLAITSAAAVWLAARSALGVNADTIAIVHLLGGTDRQIARIFERSLGFDAIFGGVLGLAFGLATVLILGSQFADLGMGMAVNAGSADGSGAGLPGPSYGGLGWIDWLLIATIPLFAVAIAMLTARLTVLTNLRRRL